MFNKLNKIGSLFVFLFVLILLFSMARIAECASITTALGNKNSSGEYRFTIDSDGIVTFQTDTAINFPYQSGTTNDTLTAADSGRTYVIISGGTNAPIMQLPVAAVGMEFPFVLDITAYSLYVNPNGTDIINYASLSAGDAIYNSSKAKGDSITFFCVVANQWSVKHINGTWATAGGIGD